MKTRSFSLWNNDCVLAVTEDISIDSAYEFAQSIFRSVDKTANRYDLTSELGMLNAQAESGDVYQAVSPVLADFLQLAFTAREVSGGLIDPQILSILKAWGCDRESRFAYNYEPTPQPISTEAAYLDWSDNEPFVFIPRGSGLDLDAVTKARTADLVAKGIAAKFGGGALVILGSDAASAGRGTWEVELFDGHHITLTDTEAVATCVPDHRTFDPRYNRPLKHHWKFVTVRGSTCVEANIAALSVAILGEQGQRYAELNRFEALCVPRDNVLIEPF